MNKWHFSAMLCASLMLLASCSKQQGQPQVAAPATNNPPAPQEAKDDTKPSLKIQGRHELPFGARTKATVWSLRGQKVKELTARLLVCTDGKAQETTEIICVWDDPSKPINGQLVLLVQDGEPFGVKGKRLPSLSLSFQSGGPRSKTEKSTSALIPGENGVFCQECPHVHGVVLT